VSAFQVPEGMEVQLWANSPMLFNPAAMDIDHEGRVWVSEGINYRKNTGRKHEGDAIRVLQDTDGDGKADKQHIFVQEKELEAALGIAVFDNVVVVSNTPNIIVYTDVNRDLVFDPKVDKKEYLMTGFDTAQHDHSLHAISAGPDGRWYFSNGNCGAKFTDKSGKTFRIGSAYLRNEYTGQKSDDGRVYIGGFNASMNDDGTDVQILSHNARNNFDMTCNSLGDKYLCDNDDPPACRTGYIVEGGSFGFCSADGTRTWPADKRHGQPTAIAEWRQEDPGVIPAGDVYGGGAPAGVGFYEGNAFGSEWQGMLMVCETARNVVFGYKPVRVGAGMKLERFDLMTSNTTGVFAGGDFNGGANNISNEKKTFFRPSDVVVGTDGAIYVCDWYDSRSGGHTDLDETCSGAIYRIVPKGKKLMTPKYDFGSIKGLVEALQSTNGSVRYLAVKGLKAQGKNALTAIEALMKHQDQYIAARAAWVAATLGQDGIDFVKAWVSDKEEWKSMVALKALRSVNVDLKPMMASVIQKGSAGACAELLAFIRKTQKPMDYKKELVALAKRYDGKDRSFLEALGMACEGAESEIYQELNLSKKELPHWLDLAWRLHPQDGVKDLVACATDKNQSLERQKKAVDALCFTPGALAAESVFEVYKKNDALKEYIKGWLIILAQGAWVEFKVFDRLKTEGIFDLDQLTYDTVMLPPVPPSTLDLAKINQLKGDIEKGKMRAQACLMCHQLEAGVGAEFGPSLKGWGLTQPLEVIAKAIVEPSHDIAHGFEGVELVTKDGKTIQGIVLSSGKELVSIRCMGGVTYYVPRKKIKAQNKLTTSLMMSAAMLGLNEQDVADITAYLRQAK
jgi:putative membrane-bound dehydrogenase-like protein